MKFIPADDRIIALQTKPETTTASGFLLAPGNEIKPPTCKVIAVGKDISDYKVGDVVLFAQPQSAEATFRTLKIEDDEYIFLTMSDVMAKVEE